MPYRYDPYACDPHYYDEDPPACVVCDAELPDEPTSTWTKEEPVGEDLDGNWMYDTVTYSRFTCTDCGEDTVRNNL